jgi:ATP-dependent exoDNAse (exonuclease V) alpha subunit
VNKQWMDKKIAKGVVHKFIERNVANRQSQDTYLYKGLPVIACVTSNKHNMANGEYYKVIDFDEEFVTIKNKAVEKKIMIKEVNKLLNPAYCITTHKSQGLSFSEPYTILEWKHMCPKLRYVALSRATNKALINFVD